MAFGCASDKTRFAENPFFASSRFDPKTTGSLTPVQDPAPLFPKAPVGMATNNTPSGSFASASQQTPSGTVAQSGVSQSELVPLPSQSVQTQPQSAQSAIVQNAPVSQVQSKQLSSQVAKPVPEAKIAAGMIIPVKGGKWAVDGGSMVSLGDGETLSTLANRYGVPETTLRKVNGFSPSAKPVPGTRLIIPVFLSDTAVNAKSNSQLTTVSSGQSPGVDKQQMQKVPVLAQQEAAPVGAKPNSKVASLGTAPTGAIDTTPETETAATEQAGVEKTIATTGFRWPARGRVILSFGEANGVKNSGINIALPPGTPVKAAESGVVAYSGNEVKGQGNLVMIRHADGWVSIYANNSELKVKRGDEVKRGQVIALSGQTGDVASPQLHFELRKGSAPVDPVAHLSDD